MSYRKLGQESDSYPKKLYIQKSLMGSSRPSDSYIASVNHAMIDSDIGLLPVWYQAIIWFNAGLLYIGLLGNKKFSENIDRNPYILQENAIANVICKISAILSRLKVSSMKSWATASPAS